MCGQMMTTRAFQVLYVALHILLRPFVKAIYVCRVVCVYVHLLFVYFI
jgi:hypothetical protein